MNKSCFPLVMLLCWMGVLPAVGVEVRSLRVEVSGGPPIEDSFVLSHVELEVGRPFNRSAVANDVRNLQASGRFARVEVAVEETWGGVEVVYRVEPRPYLRRLRIKGVDALSERKVRGLLELEAGQGVDDAVMAVAAQRLETAYREKSFPDVEVSWTIDLNKEEGWCDVLVRVDEGRRAKVRRFVFEGRQALSEKNLRSVLRHKRAHPLAWLTGAGRYDPDEAAADRMRIAERYRDAGYLDVEVEGPEVLPARRRRVALLYRIREGRRYTMGPLSVEGVELFSDETLRSHLPPLPDAGQPVSLGALRAAAEAVRNLYRQRGYIDTRVQYHTRADPASGETQPLLTVREGKEAYIEDIRIRGNTRTHDKVVRRELAVMPGDLLNENRVRTSERRLMNLGYFSFVQASHKPTLEPARYDLVFDVEEKPTGQFMMGAGFSSIDDLVGFVELSQGNFDLFGWPRPTGAGQKIKLRGQFGTKRRDVELSFVEPWLFNRKLALGVDLYRHDTRFFSDDYDQRNLGGSLSLSRALAPHVRGTVKYALEEIDVYNVSPDASPRIIAEKGRRTKSALTLSTVRDTRDGVFVPTRGHQATLAATLAGGPLAGNTDLYRLEARINQFIPLWFSHVLCLKARGVVVEEYGDSEHVPIFDRLFLGGATTVRGFRYRDVGPKDERGEPIGGRSLAFASAEYTLPVVNAVRLALFYDTGMVWEKAYRFDGHLNSGYGVGLRLDIPGFPLRLDYGWPIKTDEFNERSSGRFTFLLGYGF